MTVEEDNNDYMNYIDQVPGYKLADKEVKKPAHRYTLHIVRALLNEECF